MLPSSFSVHYWFVQATGAEKEVKLTEDILRTIY